MDPRDSVELIDHAMQSQQTRRSFLRRALAVSAAVPLGGALLAACGGDVSDDGGSSDGGGSSSGTQAPASTPTTAATSTGTQAAGTQATGSGDAKQGGVATITVLASPTAWDLTKSTWENWRAVQYLYDRVIVFDNNEELHPQLAESWEVSDDGLTVTLKLREDVKFHDGTPYNAEALKFNIQRHIDMPDSSYYATFMHVDEVEIVDEFTAKIHLKTVRVNILFDLSLWGALQVSPTAYADIDSFNSHPVGTGPFKFKEYEPDSHIEYVRNEDYWDGPPPLDGVKVRIIPEANVQLLELEAKTVDAIHAVNPKDLEAVEKMGAVLESQISPGTQFFSINVSQGPTAELAVRKAIARGIDRDAIIEKVLFGTAEKARAGAPKSSPYYDESVPMVEYDPEEAAAILDEAGWTMGPNGIRERDGQPLFLNILSTDYGGYGLYNQIAQDQLKELGFDSEITTLEWGAYLDQWRQNQGEWHLTFHSQGSLLHSIAAMEASWDPENFWHIHQLRNSTDPELMEVAAKLKELFDTFNTSLSMEDRKAAAVEAQKLVQEWQLTVWLWHSLATIAVQPTLKDYAVTHHSRVIELTKAWHDK